MPLFIAAIGITGFAACDKVEPPETNEPVITVASPTEGQVLHAGDTLDINVTYTDDTGITHYSADIKNNSVGNNIFSVLEPINQLSFTLDTFKVISDTGHYELVLYGDDRYDNFKNKSVLFTVIP